MDTNSAQMNFTYTPAIQSTNIAINEGLPLSTNIENQEPACSSAAKPLTIKETVTRLLQQGHQKDTDPETYKAALDAVRFEHQRLQNEFMSLMVLNEHVQQKLDALADNNIKLELELELKD